ncbi:hypothetical protein CRG98_044225 [Punica granatum]|uniref:Retrovirus-related Pol polyprotein from transposon TNT 1-94 n=1 Tax=Punica granatum TaxID=22663 RepID=A0A2I0HUU9_PUNGR|nr:hypothetical protein CRG98_044225 [Punica granatum]
MAKTLSIIQLSLLSKVLREVCDLGSTPEVWKKLESRYLQKSLTNMLYLKQRLYKLRMSLETSIGDHVDLFYQIVLDLANVNVMIEDDNQALLIPCFLLESYESFVNTMLYGRINITVEDANASLNSKELQEMGPRLSFEGLEGSSRGDESGVGVGIYVLQGKVGTMTSLERSTPEEKYLDDLGLKRLMGVGHCIRSSKSESRGQVEKPVKKVEFVMKDLETRVCGVRGCSSGKDFRVRNVRELRGGEESSQRGLGK